MVLVIGGSASGKSALGEQICCDLGGKLLYIATMRPFGPEAAPRIVRHQAIRAGKGFHTVERYRDLDCLELDGFYNVALLEDMGNLAANQMFEIGLKGDAVAEAVLRGIGHLRRQVGTLVIIANDLFASAEQYAGEMEDYLNCVGRIHRELARQAQTVIEAVCGLPLTLKGAYPIIQSEERCP